MNQTKAVKAGKEVIKVIATFGVAKVVNNAIKASMPLATGRVDTVLVAIGSFVLVNAVCAVAINQLDRDLTEILTSAGVLPTEEKEEPLEVS